MWGWFYVYLCHVYNTIMSLSFRTDRSGQTENCLCCLLFHLHLLKALNSIVETHSLSCVYSKVIGCPIIFVLYGTLNPSSFFLSPAPTILQFVKPVMGDMRLYTQGH